MLLTEDKVYRASTQYRLWTFTPDSIRSLRESTNLDATERVSASIKRSRAQAPAHDATTGADGLDIATLAPDEELKLVTKICKACIEFADFARKNTKFNFPSNVVATAVQYVKRFYLYNSIMVYDPKKIMPTCLFLATKTEHHWTRANELASLLGKTMTAADLLAPEYLVSQALRFTYDIKHPYLGLNGAHMELLALANGTAVLPPGSTATPQTAQADMQALLEQPRSSNGSSGDGNDCTEHALTKRIGVAYNAARGTLKSVAPISDAYFHYSPAHIGLAALLLADEPLALFYIGTKLPNGADAATTFRKKVIASIRSCAQLLQAQMALLSDAEFDEECKNIARKRDLCSDPDKADLISLHAAQKQGGRTADKANEKAAKRRKLDGRQSEPFWGPELKKS